MSNLSAGATSDAPRRGGVRLQYTVVGGGGGGVLSVDVGAHARQGPHLTKGGAEVAFGQGWRGSGSCITRHPPEEGAKGCLEGPAGPAKVPCRISERGLEAA